MKPHVLMIKLLYWAWTACGQDTILVGHFPLTGHYFEPWGLPGIFNPVSPGHPLLVNVSTVDLFFSFTPVYITGHPSCLDMNIQLVAVIQTYPWQCMECKTCIICRDPFDEVINRHGPPLKILYLLYRYWWNTRIFPFTNKSYLHRVQWRYYFYLLRVRILVSPWLLTWLANETFWNRKYKHYCLLLNFISEFHNIFVTGILR